MNRIQKIIKRFDWHQKNWYAVWHTWAGIFAGAILIVVSLTGAILVFENEIDVATHPEFFQFEKGAKKHSFQEVTERVKTKYPDLTFLGIYEMSDLNGVYQLNILEEGTKVADKKFQQLFVNPYLAKILGIRTYEETFIGFVRKIHTTLLVPKIGKYLVGISSLTCLLLIVTGLRLWIPKKVSQLKSRLKLDFSKPSKKVNYDIHNVLGFYFSPVISMLSLSGVTFTFSQFFIMILFLLNFQSPNKIKEVFGQKSICKENCETLSVNEIEKQVRNKYPKASLSGINFPQNKTASYMAMLSEKSSSELGTVLLVFINQYTGEIQVDSNHSAFNLANAYFNWIDAIHFGKLGGWTTRIIVLLGSLMTATLFVTGFIIWIPRWHKGKNYIKKLEKKSIK